MRAEIRATVGLALPMILGQGVQMLMHVIDTAMVGRLGVRELAASSMGNNAAALFFFVGIGLGSTMPVLVARAFGAGDRQRMNRVLRHGLGVSLTYSLGCVAVFAAAAPWILPFFGSAEIARIAKPYALLLLCSLVPALIVQNLRGFAEAQRRPWLPLGNIALGVGLNVIFNYVLIYGRFGLPALGVTGAALGTLLARCLMLAHFAWLLRRQPEIAPAPGSWRPAAVRGGMYREYVPIALPFAAIAVAMVGNTVVVSSLMSRFGEVTLAAHEIVRQLTFLLFTVSQAFSFAVAIRVGHAAGANDAHAVRRVAWSSVCVAGGAMCVIGGAVALGRHVLPGWFIKASTSGGETVIGLASGYLAMVAWSLPAEALTYTSVGAFRGLANLRVSAAIYVCGLWLVCLPLAYALGFLASGGGLGIWRGLMIGNWATALALVGLLWRTLQRRPTHAS